MIFVVGATGLVGSTVCKGLAARGQKVRALVRSTSDPAKIKALVDAGVVTVIGDLKDEASLRAALAGVGTVVSTASSTLSRAEGDSIESVDRDGQIRLIDVAKTAGVKHFIYVSFPDQGVDSPLADAKRAVEAHLRSSGLAYTILQPYFFAEVWLSPALGFDVANGKANLFGDGRNPISWISFLDVASAVIASIGNAKAHGKVLQLGGPAGVAPLDVVRLFEELSGKKIAVDHVPEDALRGQLASTSDPMQRSFTALMLSYALGYVVDNAPAVDAIGFEPTPLRTIAARILGVSEGATMAEESDVQVEAEDLVIYGDDGKYYLVKKNVYTQTELPRSLQGTPSLLVQYGSVLATVDPGTNPGVGCACYILNLTAVRKPKPIGG